MESIRLAIVYLHLIACCVAVGLVLTNDLSVVKSLLKGNPVRYERDHMATLQWTISVALVALWITGSALISIDSLGKGLTYYANPKIQAKIAIVCLLTLNGFLLHRLVVPAMSKAGSLLSLPLGERLVAALVGSVSFTSWFYAAMLGVGRPLNWKYALPELLTAYPILVIGGTLGMLALMAWARYAGKASAVARFRALTNPPELKFEYRGHSRR